MAKLKLQIKRHKAGWNTLSINSPRPQNLLRVASVKTVRGLVHFFTALDFLASQRVLVVAAMGLGLGFGFSLPVFQRPNAAGAETMNVIQLKAITIDPVKLRLVDRYIEFPVSSEVGSASLGDQGLISITVPRSDRAAQTIPEINLGETIEVIGSNNGVYVYRVVEVRLIESDQLVALKQQTQTTLLLITPTNLLGDRLAVIVARPIQ